MNARTLATALLALCGALLLPAAWAADATAPAAAPALLISYHVPPAQRPALRAALAGATRARLQRLKADGVLASYRLLFSRHAESEQWDALALVVFTGPAQVARWAAVERETPAALDPAAAVLLSAVHSVPMELSRSRREGTAPASPVVLVIPYLSLVAPADYLAYADGYVIPQFEGWMQQGALSQYQLLASSFPAGRAWTHLLLQDWRSDEALAGRAAVVAKVRAQLKDVPSWRAISDSKAKLREEKQAVIADDLAAGSAP